MSDAEASRSRRQVTKTAAITEFDQAIKKSALIRESKARCKKVREQLAALGEEEEEEEEEEERPKKSTKKKTKGKEKASARSNDSASSDPKSKSKSEKDKAVSQEQANVAEVMRDEARRKMLIELFHYRDQISRDQLNVLDLNELEDMWAKLEASNASSAKAPAAKVPAKSKPKAPAKTPAKKVSAALPDEDTVEWIGSPMNALLQAKGQSERADAPSPLPKSRKRDPSTGRERDAKRARTKPAAQPSKSAVVSELNKPATQPAGHAEETSVSSGSTEREADGEEINIDLEVDALSVDESEAKEVKPLKKKGSTDKKGRPTSRNYQGIAHQLLDQAVLETVRVLYLRDLCPGQAELDLYIEEGWDCAVSYRRQNPESWPLTKDLVACIKSRVNSWRGHAHERVLAGIAGAYDLGSSNTPQYVMDRVAKIVEKEFHRDPKDGRKGNYEAPYLAETIYKLFYVGRVPIGIRFKQVFEIISLPTIAYAAALIEKYISCYGATGRFIKPARLGVGELMVNTQKHYNNLIKVLKNASTGGSTLQRDTALRARSFVGQTPVLQLPQSKSAPGVLSDDDFDVEDLSSREPAQRQKARSTSPAFKKLGLAVDRSSSDGDRRDAMDLDGVEVNRPYTPATDDSDETESLAGSEGAQKISKKDERPYVPLDGSDNEMVDAPAGQKGEGKDSSGEESGSSSEEESSSDSEIDNNGPGLATGVDKAFAGRESIVEGGGNGNGKDEEEGEVEDEEGAEGGSGDRPAGAEVGGLTLQVRDEQDSDLTDSSETEAAVEPVDTKVDKPTNDGARSKPACRNDTHEQPSVTLKAPTQESTQVVGAGDAATKRFLTAEQKAKRMEKAMADLLAEREAKEKEAAAAKADRAKASKGGKKGPAGKKGSAKKAAEKVAEKETVGDEATSTRVEKAKAKRKANNQEGEVGGSARATRSKRGVSAA